MSGQRGESVTHGACEHLSLDGVDVASDGPDKVWRCLECDDLFRFVERDSHRGICEIVAVDRG